jgi:L-cysteine:1D-myo-inositol 2-amino-2-deoxy-alpha-D-glucopyranoside ligase
MNLYNSQSQQIEPLRPGDDAITLYVCGITPYDTTHLGHAFTYCAADVLVRYLEMKGHRIIYAQNVTDIDDDILKKAQTEAEDWYELGNKWTRHFIEDMQALNVRPPDYFPRATAAIPQIIEAVQALLMAGVAYEAAGSVYFEVAAWPEYGRLSHIPHADMLPIANEHGNQADDPYKKAPLDFVLWQAQKDDEPAWQSPWGVGRPGWHIECSTIAHSFLGEPVDIHMGGADLLFPHHESEAAQREAVNGERPFVRFWLHTAMVAHEGEKMSKSLGNLVMVRDLLPRYSADALRLYLAQHHYRQPWSYDEASLKRAAQYVEKLKAALTAVSTGTKPINLTPAQNRFAAALEKDLDTPKGVATLLNVADEIMFRAPNGYRVDEAQALLRQLSAVFGVRLDAETPEKHVAAGWQEHRQQFEEKS